VLIAHGRDKQKTVTRLAAAAGYDPDWPATVVAACRDGAIYADEAAASRLPPGQPALTGRDPASQA
jgi:glucosamine-6-phosphate deaminase